MTQDYEIRNKILSEMLVEIVYPTLEDGDFYAISRSRSWNSGITLMFSHHAVSGAFIW